MLLAFNCLGKLCDANLQPFYLPADIHFIEHLPVLGFTENTKLYTANKDSSIHDLVLYQVSPEEFNAEKTAPAIKGKEYAPWTIIL